MLRWRLACLLVTGLTCPAHDLITTKITWSREISRVVGEKCASCHGSGGSSFPLTNYEEVRPWAKAIKEQVAERRMPPYGAVKGFSDLLGEESLTQEQIGLITKWVEGGAPKGDPALLPQANEIKPVAVEHPPSGPKIIVSGTRNISRPTSVAALKAESLREGASVQVVAQAPDGAVTPLLWLYQYKKRFDRTYFLRRPLTLPAGTKIISVPPSAGSIAVYESTGGVQANTALTVKPEPSPASAAIADAGLEQLDYVCPMDADVRSDKPGKCPRCGMTLKVGIPNGTEYQLEVTGAGKLKVNQPAELNFKFTNPVDGALVRHFQVMHEKLFHLFVVSSDLEFFQHVHPVQRPDGTFSIRQTFPTGGMYRILADVFPVGGTPQLLPRTLFVSSGQREAFRMRPANLKPNEGPQHGENTEVRLEMEPKRPIAGTRTRLVFHLSTADEMQQYLGAWAHMFLASDDLIDSIHDHPTVASGGTDVQFDVIFPRAHTYRVWIQFQRNKVVNTIAVTVPVSSVEQASEISTAR